LFATRRGGRRIAPIPILTISAARTPAATAATALSSRSIAFLFGRMRFGTYVVDQFNFANFVALKLGAGDK